MTKPNPDHYNIFTAGSDYRCYKESCGGKIYMGDRYASWPRQYMSEFHGPVYHIECNEIPKDRR